MSSFRGEWGEEGKVWGPPGGFVICVWKKCSHATHPLLVIKAEIMDGGWWNDEIQDSNFRFMKKFVYPPRDMRAGPESHGF